MADLEDYLNSPITEAIALPDPLRADVRLLGGLLGESLVESGSAGLLDDVEHLRKLTRHAHREESAEYLDEAAKFVASLSLQRAEEVARAFTVYFHLVNVAEEYHRVRTYRQRELTDATAPEALDHMSSAVAKLAGEVGEEEALKRLHKMEFHPVLTAHPTEARRRAITNCIRRISLLLQQHDDARLGGTYTVENKRKLRAEIDTLWRTAPLRTQTPTPYDEIRTAMSVFENTLFDLMPLVYRQLDDGLNGDASGLNKPIAPAFVRLGTWIGSDRDGNPNVTHDITWDAALMAHHTVLGKLVEAASALGRSMTQDYSTTPTTPELDALIASMKEIGVPNFDEIVKRSPGEPYRQVVLMLAKRLQATLDNDDKLKFQSADEFLRDLRIVQDSLLHADDRRGAYGALQDLIWQVETFGFHLAEHEVRQHSKVHREALAELQAGGELSPMTKEVRDVFRVIKQVQDSFGVIAMRRYIISFTKTSEDIANVYKLAEISFDNPADAPTLDVIPLFETFEDLNASTTILSEMLEIPQVKQRLAATGRKLEVMLGYSDSSKDVGPVAATFTLHDAQGRIARWAQDNDIELTLFHGRGGALGRGGGPATTAVMAQPPGSVDGRFKLTEQGEVIFARYANLVVGKRHVGQVGAATLLASAPSTERQNLVASEKYHDMAMAMDDTSRERFFELVHADGFAKWFTTVTPQEEIGWLALGSRPARRGLSVESLEDLRAIPWVFAWAQTRLNLAGWFGLGTALKSVGDINLLQDAYREWPLFTSMIDNIEMSLSKTDERIATRYLDLGDREDLKQIVLDELKLTKEWVLKTAGHADALQNRPNLQRAVQVRSPYVDALSLLQLRALSELREDEADKHMKLARSLMLISVNGVAAGLQNTG